MKATNVLIALSFALVVTSCATDDPNRRAKTGALIGAVAGAVIGHQVDDDKGAVVGAIAGALAGGAVGHYVDNQQAEFERELAEEQRRSEIELERLKDDVLKLSLNSEVSFDSGSSDLKPPFYPTLDKLSALLQKYNRTVVHVIGHTDSQGSEEFNMRLSSKRAESVANYQLSQGVPSQRVRTEGRGESEPRASNDSGAGRQLNRRVEIFIKPIVEGQEAQAFLPPA